MSNEIESEIGNEAGPSTTRKHPIFGCMKGTIRVAPGVDLTEPAFPDWEEYAEAKYGPDSELGKLWARVEERWLSQVETGQILIPAIWRRGS